MDGSFLSREREEEEQVSVDSIPFGHVDAEVPLSLTWKGLWDVQGESSGEWVRRER